MIRTLNIFVGPGKQKKKKKKTIFEIEQGNCENDCL